MADLPNSSGPSGWTALGLVIAWFCLGFFCYPVPNRFRPPEESLYEYVVWGVGFAVCVGVSLASLRRGPANSQPAALSATVASLLCVAGVMMLIAMGILAR